jgi:hypothetical protein
MIPILIHSIPHRDQRYPTVGDWYETKNDHRIVVSEMKNPTFEFLVALHELIESQICEYEGVSQSTVDTFDMAHPEEKDPGDLSYCPYRRAHEFALAIEMLVAQRLGVDWQVYTKAIEALDE